MKNQIFKYKSRKYKIQQSKLKMFQNSFVTRINIKCPIHFNNKITFVCSQVTCQKNPFICDECMNSKLKDQHYGHQFNIQKVDRFLQRTSESIKNEKKSIQRLYKSILSDKQNQNLLKWQQQKLQHFQSIQNHLNTLKFQIDQQIRSIIQKFQSSLNEQKQFVYRQLETYFQTYKSKFHHFTELTQPVVKINQMYSYYQSKNTLTLKLMSLETNKLTKWLNQLKFNLHRAQMATRKQTDYCNQVQHLGIVTNELMDELPRLKSIDYQRQLPQIMKQCSRKILCSLVSYRKMRLHPCQVNTTVHNMRSISMSQIPTQHIRSMNSLNPNRPIQRKRVYQPE